MFLIVINQTARGKGKDAGQLKNVTSGWFELISLCCFRKTEEATATVTSALFWFRYTFSFFWLTVLSTLPFLPYCFPAVLPCWNFLWLSAFKLGFTELPERLAVKKNTPYFILHSVYKCNYFNVVGFFAFTSIPPVMLRLTRVCVILL